jgi:hypothetical protein
MERIWAKVRKGADSECWLWTAALNNKGYPFLDSRPHINDLVKRVDAGEEL